MSTELRGAVADVAGVTLEEFDARIADALQNVRLMAAVERRSNDSELTSANTRSLTG